MLELTQIALIFLLLVSAGVAICRRLPRVIRQLVRVMSFEDCSLAAGSWLDSRVMVHSLLSWCHENRPPPGGEPVVCPLPVNTHRKMAVNTEVVWTGFPKGFNIE